MDKTPKFKVAYKYGPLSYSLKWEWGFYLNIHVCTSAIPPTKIPCKDKTKWKNFTTILL